MNNNDNSGPTVRVKFVALQKKYAVTDLPIAVPLSLRRYGLSEIVNHLLDLDEHVPFEILLNKKFIRKPLGKEIEDQIISTENVITLEYTESSMPPSVDQSIEADDWVSSLAALSSTLYFAGLYDNSLQLWDTSNKMITKEVIHSACVKAVAVVDTSAETPMIVTASQDQTLGLSLYNKSTSTIEKVASLQGHSASVESVAINPSKDKVISCGWDNDLRLWHLNIDDANEVATEGTAKKLKGKAKPVKQMESIITYSGHSGPVTGCFWTNESTFCSSSWDHSIRLWDMGTGVNNQTMVGPNAIHDIAAHSSTPSIIASANSDSAVRLWDSRTKEGSMITMTMKGHSGMVSCVSWCPDDTNKFATGSYDNSVKIWDIRSSLPLFSIDEHTENVLCIDWSGNTIASGSSDKTIKFSSSVASA